MVDREGGGFLATDAFYCATASRLPTRRRQVHAAFHSLYDIGTHCVRKHALDVIHVVASDIRLVRKKVMRLLINKGQADDRVGRSAHGTAVPHACEDTAR
jgi:hypothetical protein